jgi:hypothetical protein
MDKIQIELRIIHPTEGTIIKRYNIDELSDLAKLADMKPVGFSPLASIGIGNFIQGAKCAVACQTKKGFLACVTRCMIDGMICDGGVDC